MNIESHNMGAYNLHFIKTNKFKTISVDVNFYREIKEDEITKRNLLKMILLDSNNDYKTERELIIESERLYDIKISSGISRIGKFSDLSFQTKFLNEKYTEEDMNKESIIFFLSLIFNPCVKEGRFVNIDKQKNRLYQEINSLKDNKIKYSMLKLMEKMKDKPYSYNPYEYYKKVISEDQIDIFVLGDFSPSEMKEIFKEYFKVNTFKKEHKNLIIPELVPRKRIVKYHEYEKVSQSQLVLLCSLNNLTDFERKYTIKLYSEILGGSSSSVLFSKVREDKGYCYYINSGVKAYDNILLINSGVEKKNIEPAIKLIRRCLKDINNGKVSDELIESSRNTIISSIKASSDTSMGIINTALSRVLVGSDDMEERINNFSKITKEDIVKVSKKVSLHTILTLEDKEEEHEEN